MKDLTGINNRIVYRLIAVIPSLVLAMLFQDVGRATAFSGIMGFYLAFVYPALLSIYSKEVLTHTHNIQQTDTIYTNIQFGGLSFFEMNAYQKYQFCINNFCGLLCLSWIKWATVLLGVGLSIYAFILLLLFQDNK